MGAQRTVRFVVALGLLIYEAAVYAGDDIRWHLIVVYAAMMGLPIAELGDELRRKRDDDG